MGKFPVCGAGRVPGFARVAAIDPIRREFDLTSNSRGREVALVPTTVMVNDWFRQKPTPEAFVDWPPRFSTLRPPGRQCRLYGP
jgi:hypothetical protein